MLDAIHVQQNLIETEVARLQGMCESNGYVMDWLRQLSEQYMIAAFVAREVECLDEDGELDTYLMLAAAETEGSA